MQKLKKSTIAAIDDCYYQVLKNAQSLPENTPPEDLRYITDFNGWLLMVMCRVKIESLGKKLSVSDYLMQLMYEMKQYEKLDQQ